LQEEAKQKKEILIKMPKGKKKGKKNGKEGYDVENRIILTTY
jgi:hypothetical protein